MKILLAPMEGVVDQQMRTFLTTIGHFDHCVTEFLRVTDRLLPARVFKRICPELLTGGKTPSGTPVILQLLGGVPEIVAVNAQRAVELGALGIDLNFGCPSKFVNRRAGGAVLLKEPERVHDIVAAVRKVVPSTIPFSAKIRLGFDDTSLTLENAHAVEDAGADYIVVHGRTKKEGYRPPADWHWIARIREALKIRVIANGDINSVEDYKRCRDVSGCDDVMIGRGAITQPDLIQQIRQHQQNQQVSPMGWAAIMPQLELMLLEGIAAKVPNQHLLSRIKQWLCYLKRHYTEAQQLFDNIKTLHDPEQAQILLQH